MYIGTVLPVKHEFIEVCKLLMVVCSNNGSSNELELSYS